MEGGSSGCFLVWALLAVLLSQNVVLPVTCCTNPPTIPCPTPSYGTPPSRSGGGSYGKPPSHGSGGGSYGTPPSHGGGGGSYGTPPSHGSGGGSYKPPPSHRGGGCRSPPSRPPHRGGGGYYSPPATPSHGSGAPSLNPPQVPTPTPLVPVTPTPIINPTPPMHPITGTCDFWRTHPALVWGIIGYWAPIGGFFGLPIAPIFGADPTILQALGCPRMDGYGALLREGTASFLNSMADKRFTYTTQQVKDAFTASLASEKMAGSQAQRFKLANEGRLNN